MVRTHHLPPYETPGQGRSDAPDSFPGMQPDATQGSPMRDGAGYSRDGGGLDHDTVRHLSAPPRSACWQPRRRQERRLQRRWRAPPPGSALPRPPGTGAPTPVQHLQINPVHSQQSVWHGANLPRLQLSSSQIPRQGRPSGVAARLLHQPRPGTHSHGFGACEEDGARAGQGYCADPLQNCSSHASRTTRASSSFDRPHPAPHSSSTPNKPPSGRSITLCK
jgi:hypothetical protein